MPRKHRPRQSKATKGYQRYRQCLRWDFGFTCAFCLVHEVDWTCIGLTEGTGLFTVEHFLPQSTNKDQANLYDNCFYACRSCNTSRRRKPVCKDGAALLDPTKVSWGRHFNATDGCLKPAARDAQYTHQAYRLDNSLKVALRRKRQRRIRECLDVVQSHPEVIANLTAKVRKKASPAEMLEDLRCIRILEKHLENAKHDLEKLAAIPRDYGRKCACNTTKNHSLPDWLEAQTMPLPD